CIAGQARRLQKRRRREAARNLGMASRIKTVLEMIKFEHSVFALPFALTGALLAARWTRHDWPSLRQILGIIVAMVAARSAAMTMNRIVDLRYDRENPRTKQRALPTGALTLQFAWFFTIVAVAIFFMAAWQLNPLALTLAPLFIARIMHIGVIAFLVWLALSFGLPWPAWAGIAVVASLLAYEHSLVKADDLSNLDAAFFTVNGYISMLFLLFWGAAAAVWRV